MDTKAKPSVLWNAEYKGTTVVVSAIYPGAAQTVAAIQMGVPKSREKHIRVQKK